MKKKNQRKVVKLLKELDLYKKFEGSIMAQIGYSDPTEVKTEIYIRLNDVIEWEDLIK